MKKFTIFAVILLVFTLALSACDNTADDIEEKATNEIRKEALRQAGLPNIVNFQQKKTLKMILELCDKENLICYAYLYNKMTGKLVFIGKCIGYGIPFSAQYTNPERAVNGRVLPQPDPNGLFMPSSSQATWLLWIDPRTNKTRVIYCEPSILVSPSKLPDSLVQNPEFYKLWEKSSNVVRKD